MDLTVVFFLTSGLFLGWVLGANDAANVFGTAVGTRMVRFSTAALVCGVFVILGAVVSGSGAAQTLGKLGSINTLPGAFMAASAAAITVYGMTKCGLPVSTSQAIVGAIIGWNFYSGSQTDWNSLVKILLTWVACPILAGFFAIILFKTTVAFSKKVKLHLLRLDAYTRAALILAGAFGAYSLGANNIANVMGVFVSVSPFTEFELAGFITMTSVQQLFLLGGIAIAIGVFTYSKKVMFTVGHGLFRMSPVAAWVVVVAHSIVLFLFASQGLENFLTALSLPTIPLVPVSSSQAIVGAVIGIGLLRGGGNIQWGTLGQISIGWVATPIIASLVCFVSLFFLQNVFNQQVYQEVTYQMDEQVLEKYIDNPAERQQLSILVGRKFENARAFTAALEEVNTQSTLDKSSLLRLTRTRNLRVDATTISRLYAASYSAGQLQAIHRLDGRLFRHDWQLFDALQAESPEWQPQQSDTGISRSHNKSLRKQQEFLVRVLEHSATPPT